MSRASSNEYRNGSLRSGFDYDNQAWVKDGKYVRCGHPEDMNCGCFGRKHEHETVASLPLTDSLEQEIQDFETWQGNCKRITISADEKVELSICRFKTIAGLTLRGPASISLVKSVAAKERKS